MKTIFSFLAFQIFSIFPLLAILDTNANGLSDVWEKQYNTSQLFQASNATHAATADPDQDGWTNAQEALAGTNPFSANGSNGKTALAIQSTATAATYELTWPVIPGKNYRIQASTNLHFWVNIGPIIDAAANDTAHTIAIQATDPENTNTTAPPPKLFYRVKVTDRDEDSDDLTTYEEYLVGTNLLLKDTDRDGISDIMEILTGTSPTNPDTDGDGIDDGHEQHFGSNPILAASMPYRHVNALKALQYGCNDNTTPNNPSSGIEGLVTTLATWDETNVTSEIQSFKTLQELRDMLALKAFPNLPTEDELKPEETNLFESTQRLEEQGRSENAYLSARRIWTVLPELAEAQSKFHFIVRHRIFNENESFITTYDKLEQYVSAGAMNSAPLDISPQESPGIQQGTIFVADAKTIPVQLLSDLNNDGVIDTKDITLRDAAQSAAAGSNAKILGTEFMFANDNLSNGKWDIGDSDPDRPKSEINDDDAEAIAITCGIEEGEIWLEHPGIDRLTFYKTAECKDALGLKTGNRFVVSGSNPLPKIIYARADVDVAYPADNPQVEGELVLKFREKIDGEFKDVQTSLKLDLTVIKRFGASRFFETVEDYIRENNTTLCVVQRAYGADTFRLVFMLEQQTRLFPIDASRRANGGQLKGIDAVIAAYPATVTINGNQCFFIDDRNPAGAGIRGDITDRCHGRVVRNGVLDQIVSSDAHLPAHGNPFSPLAGPEPMPNGDRGGNYIRELSTGNYSWGASVLPSSSTNNAANPRSGMGGLSANFDKRQSDGNEIQSIGYYNKSGQATKGIIFSASSEVGTGRGKDLAHDAKKSGVKQLTGGRADEIELLFLDGSTSVALAYSKGGAPIKTVIKGAKHNGPPYYYVNTYLIFQSWPIRQTP